MLRPGWPGLATVMALALFFTDGGLAANEDRAARQAELDSACEAAREEKLAPLRQQFIQQCVDEKQFDSVAECAAFYADYGARSGNRAPLFYDLPPCVEAFEYAQSERSGE